LPLYLCNEFWGSKRNQINPYEKFKILAITGGIPRYLEEVRADLSAEQNILHLCYQPTGILFSEFNQIFSDLFAKKKRIYKELVRQVTNGKTTLEEIAESLGRTKSGKFSEYLTNLVEAGFLAKDVSWNIGKEREVRLSHYRVCDNYIRFYLKYIEPFENRILANRVKTLPKGWKSMMDLQFENLVCNNVDSLLSSLELEPDEVIWSGPYFQRPSARQEGCQIDYLIQTKHRVLYICEIKFSDREVPYSVLEEMEEKSRRLKKPKGFSIRHVLIHVNGVSESLEQDEFISNIVNFGELLTNSPYNH
jgi:hypothetical protein